MDERIQVRLLVTANFFCFFARCKQVFLAICLEKKALSHQDESPSLCSSSVSRMISYHLPAFCMTKREILQCIRITHFTSWKIFFTPTAFLVARQNFFFHHKARQEKILSADWGKNTSWCIWKKARQLGRDLKKATIHVWEPDIFPLTNDKRESLTRSDAIFFFATTWKKDSSKFVLIFCLGAIPKAQD